MSSRSAHALAGYAFVSAISVLAPALAEAQNQPAAPEMPVYLRDRGTGMPTSMFGTYIRKRELLVYPFFEYYRNHDEEYEPADFGYGVAEEFRGRSRASEGLLFIAYGLTDWLAVEVEAAVSTAEFDKSPNDSSPMPARIEESGLGDVEGQLRARLLQEDDGRPEVFSYFEIVTPNRDKVLIGTPGWEYKFGGGVIKGSRIGTFTVRMAAEYSEAESVVEPGEYAVEYLKRLSPRWRLYLGVEGTQDEVEFISEAQWHLSDRIFLKFNNAVGLTSKAADWAPEVGVMFSFPTRRP